MKNPAYLWLCFLLAGCGPNQGFDGSLEALLASQPERFATVMRDPDRFRVQIIYTQIDRDADNRPSFRSYTYRVDPGEYFYPASTIKLPVAALALEKLNRLGRPGLDRDTVMLTDKAAEFQTESFLDDTSPTGLPSVGQYIRKILVVSDNDAYNRLYEFLGQRAINVAMREKGYSGTRIVHRLEIALDPEQNAWTNPIRFVNGAEIIYRQPDVRGEVAFLGDRPELLGSAEIVAGERRERPKDFAGKNAYPLGDLHDTVMAIMFPDAVPESRRYVLTADDHRFLWRYMSEYPSESRINAYADGSHYPDGYVKFLMYGGSEPEIPRHIRIFNKVGDAYGFLTDAAYIVDFEAGVEFLLAATIYTNANGTFNDNEYEYDEIGFPFLRELGRAIHEVELARPRAHRPVLDEFRNLR
jgi:hypothetical protein